MMEAASDLCHPSSSMTGGTSTVFPSACRHRASNAEFKDYNSGGDPTAILNWEATAYTCKVSKCFWYDLYDSAASVNRKYFVEQTTKDSREIIYISYYSPNGPYLDDPLKTSANLLAKAGYFPANDQYLILYSGDENNPRGLTDDHSPLLSFQNIPKTRDYSFKMLVRSDSAPSGVMIMPFAMNVYLKVENQGKDQAVIGINAQYYSDDAPCVSEALGLAAQTVRSQNIFSSDVEITTDMPDQ